MNSYRTPSGRPHFVQVVLVVPGTHAYHASLFFTMLDLGRIPLPTLDSGHKKTKA
ncbi:hypothetical protein KBC31_00110 [Candidatus Saccharibacteria bacterium]|nr:hypothetical protein [Candidatus Saccharibacteria bacterium]